MQVTMQTLFISMETIQVINAYTHTYIKYYVHIIICIYVRKYVHAFMHAAHTILHA